MILYGVDPGKHTGIAAWDTDLQDFESVQSMQIVDAIKTIEEDPRDKKVYFEDARLRKWIPSKRGRETLQGAGSIKRDCTIWEDFLESRNIPYSAVHPRENMTKLKAGSFRKLTHWQPRTNEHGRDAGMLVFGRTA